MKSHFLEFRRFNYSALIRSGQLERSKALDKIKEVYTSEDETIINLCIGRLGLDKKYIEDIMKLKPRHKVKEFFYRILVT